jgi:hypothetical protein
MKDIFQESVDSTLTLIRQQLAQIAEKGLHVQACHNCKASINTRTD